MRRQPLGAAGWERELRGGSPSSAPADAGDGRGRPRSQGTPEHCSDTLRRFGRRAEVSRLDRISLSDRSADLRREVELGRLLEGVPGVRLVSASGGTRVGGIAFDSRRVRAGDLFVAIPGFKQDGRAYVGQALERGASAIASEAPVPESARAARIEVTNARAALADLASAYYGHPSRELTLVGVTGTDGKTSTTQLISAVLETAGRRTGWLTTVDLKLGQERRPNEFQHTTPEAVAVQSFLRELVDRRVEVAILEVSSHALALDRVRGCRFERAVFTNLSPEHLNFHGSMEAYLEAKAELFRMLGRAGELGGARFGVINADDPAGARLRERCAAPVISYGLDPLADVSARELELLPSGIRFRLTTPAGSTTVSSRLLGRFNVLNWLAAAATAHTVGIGPEIVARAAEGLPPVPGRMEPVDRGQPFGVLVDFAHTPEALANALGTAREHTAGRLMVVFGNAGERDPASRPAMARIAAELTDFFVLSLDDPLHEDPLEIATQSAAGAERWGAVRGRDFEIELDRRRAIRLLLERAQPGDAVILAGKGHESRMLVGDERLPWSDRGVAETLLTEMGWL